MFKSLSLWEKLIFQKKQFSNIIKEIFYNVDGSVSNEKTFSYKYDSYGNWIRKESKGKGTFDNRIEEREIIYYWYFCVLNIRE